MHQVFSLSREKEFIRVLRVFFYLMYSKFLLGVRGLVSYASLKNLVGSIGSVHAQRKAALNFDIALWAVAG
jgi:hypothetical protein